MIKYLGIRLLTVCLSLFVGVAILDFAAYLLVPDRLTQFAGQYRIPIPVFNERSQSRIKKKDYYKPSQIYLV